MSIDSEKRKGKTKVLIDGMTEEVSRPHAQDSVLKTIEAGGGDQSTTAPVEIECMSTAIPKANLMGVEEVSTTPPSSMPSKLAAK